MSRIGKRNLDIPEGVTVDVVDGKVVVKGPKGELSINLVENINVKVADGKVTVERENEEKQMFRFKRV